MRIHPDEPWLEKYIPESGITAIDVGANHGSWTHYLAERFSKVHAFEPNPDCWPDLFGRNIVLHKVAAWSQMQKMVFGAGPRDCFIPDKVANFFGEEKEKTNVTICMPIDILRIYDVGLIKIDVEGGERQVVLGAFETIRRDRPVIIIEMHHASNDEYIRALIKEYKFELVRHPLYNESYPAYAHHYWVIATP